MSDFVSIVMPSYNTGAYIGRSIQSVIDQTHTDWELLIVDDCSADDSVEVIRCFDDPRIVLLENNTNCGAAASRNRAISEARGRWIAFLDSDDLWAPEKLEKQIAFMRGHNYAFSYTAYEDIDPDGNPLGRVTSGPKRVTRRGMFRYCWPGCLTVMYDADRVGLIQIADIEKHNDYAMWIKICKKADCYLLDEKLAYYRKGRTDSVSTQSYTTLIKWHYKLFREAESENVPLALWHTAGNLFFGFLKKQLYIKKT